MKKINAFFLFMILVLIPFYNQLGLIEVVILTVCSMLSIIILAITVPLQEHLFNKNKLLLCLILLGVWAISFFIQVATILFSRVEGYNIDNNLFYVSQFRILLIIPIAILIYKYKIYQNTLINGLFVSSLLTQLVIYYFFITMSDVRSNINLFTHPNIASAFLYISSLLILGSNKMPSLRKVHAKYMYMFSTLISIALLGSRFALILYVLSFFIINIKKINNKNFLIALPLIFLIVPISIEYFYRILNNFSGSRFTIQDSNIGSMSWRIERWKASIDVVKDNPEYLLYGSGWNSTSFIENYSFYGSSLHNEYLRLTFELGLPFALTVIIALILQAKSMYKINKSFFAILLFILFAMFTENILLSSETLTIIIFICFYFVGILKKENNGEKNSVYYRLS